MSLSFNIEESLGGLESYIDRVIRAEAVWAAALIEKEIEILRAGGMLDEAIRVRLQTDFDTKGRIFGQIENNIKGHVAGLITAASAKAQEEVYLDAGIDTELRKWVTVNRGTSKVCPDCPSRHGQIERLIDWQDIGLPGSGWSVCGPHDDCILVLPEIEVGEIVSVP